MIVTHNNKLCEAFEEFSFTVAAMGNAHCTKEWRAKEISPPYTRLYYTLNGEGEIEFEGGHITLKAGNLYIIPAGFSFSYSCKDKMHQLYFHIKLVGSGGVDLLRGIGQVVSLETDASYLDELVRLTQGDNLLNRYLLKSLMQRDLFEALSRSEISLFTPENSRCVKKAVQYVNENLSASLTVSEVAENIFVSVNTLSHKFKKEMGESVGQYIDGLVMHKAKQLLLSSELSVAQISAELGFYDQFYFSRCFSKKFSQSPLKYRKSHQTGEV